MIIKASKRVSSRIIQIRQYCKIITLPNIDSFLVYYESPPSTDFGAVNYHAKLILFQILTHSLFAMSHNKVLISGCCQICNQSCEINTFSNTDTFLVCNKLQQSSDFGAVIKFEGGQGGLKSNPPLLGNLETNSPDHSNQQH